MCGVMTSSQVCVSASQRSDHCALPGLEETGATVPTRVTWEVSPKVTFLEMAELEFKPHTLIPESTFLPWAHLT